MIWCAAATTCAGPGPPHATGSGSSCCATGASTERGRRRWTLQHRAWVRRQRSTIRSRRPRSSRCFATSTALDAQLAAVDRQLEQVAASHPWCDPVRWLTCFRGISTLTALGLLAEIGDFRRFATARELMSLPRPHRRRVLLRRPARSAARMTKTGNRHARRLLVEAAWHYRHPPRLSARPAPTSRSSRPKRKRAPGKRRSACTNATATSPPRQAPDRRHRRRRPRTLRLHLGRHDPSTPPRPETPRSHNHRQGGTCRLKPHYPRPSAGARRPAQTL